MTHLLQAESPPPWNEAATQRRRRSRRADATPYNETTGHNGESPGLSWASAEALAKLP